MRFLNLVCQGAWRGVVAAALIISAFVWATPSLAAVTTPAQRPAVVAVSPAPGQTVGVAAPVVVTFARPVVDRAAAQGAFTVTAPSTPAGQFEWLNDRVLQWKPAGFWPAHSRIAVTLDGFRTDFNTGAAVVGVASISNHTFTVSIDGQVARVMPASMGKPSRPTPVGSFNVMSKEQSVIMDSRTIGIPLNSPEGYRLTVYYAERITSGGVYVHSAPWSVDSQGYANVSHGCINLGPDNAVWYYGIVSVGDPVSVQY